MYFFLSRFLYWLTCHNFDDPPQSEEYQQCHTVPNGTADGTKGQGQVKAKGHKNNDSVKHLDEKISQQWFYF